MIHWKCDCGEWMEAPESMKGKPVRCPGCQRIHSVGSGGGQGVENPIPQLAQPAQHMPFGKQDEKRIRRMIADSVCWGVVRGGIWLFVIYVLLRLALFAIGVTVGGGYTLQG